MDAVKFQGLIDEVNFGKQIAEKYSKEYKNRCIFLVYPDNEENVIEVSYKYIKSLVQRYQHIVFFSDADLPAPHSDVREKCRFIKLEKKEMNAIIRYAQVVERETLRIVSFVTPEQLDSTGLFGVGDITKESYVYRALFGNFAGVLGNG